MTPSANFVIIEIVMNRHGLLVPKFSKNEKIIEEIIDIIIEPNRMFMLF